MVEAKKKILVVDDEKDIVDLLEYNLVKNGFDVITASNGEEGLTKLDQNPGLIVLDVMMPKMNGYEFCVKVKESPKYKNIPVIFLTAKNSEMDEIHGLNLGANDFIQKPISINKIIARIKANLRFQFQDDDKDNDGNSIQAGPIFLDREKFEVTLDGKKISFVKKEFELMFYLASNPGKVLSRDRILSNVWGTDVLVVPRTVDVHLLNIRRKLGEHSDLIETVKGVGYRFKDI